MTIKEKNAQYLVVIAADTLSFSLTILQKGSDKKGYELRPISEFLFYRKRNRSFWASAVRVDGHDDGNHEQVQTDCCHCQRSCVQDWRPHGWR